MRMQTKIFMGRKVGLKPKQRGDSAKETWWKIKIQQYKNYRNI